MQTKLSIEDRTKIKQALPFGGIKRAAQKAQVTPQAVRDILKGEYQNAAVISALLEVIQEDKDLKAKMSANVSNILG